MLTRQNLATNVKKRYKIDLIVIFYNITDDILFLSLPVTDDTEAQVTLVKQRASYGLLNL